MDNASETKRKNLYSKKTLIVFCIFACVVFLACGIIFLINYRIAYNDSTDGGFIPPSFALKFYYFLIIVSAIAIAIVLKLIFKQSIKFGYLFLVAVFLPILCYNLNYHTLKRGGIFNFLVNDGGIFHFMAIGDYNFDGINDERYHILYDEREISSGYGGHFNDNIIGHINTKAVGKGAALNSVHASYDWEDRIITLIFQKSNLELSHIELNVTFRDPEMAKKVSFYILESEYQPISDMGIEVSHTVKEDGSVTLLFDSYTCAEWQRNSENEYVGLYFRYVIDD